jgi:hypothetical protein
VTATFSITVLLRGVSQDNRKKINFAEDCIIDASASLVSIFTLK